MGATIQALGSEQHPRLLIILYYLILILLLVIVTCGFRVRFELVAAKPKHRISDLYSLEGQAIWPHPPLPPDHSLL